jgi:Tfp pilus assembly protein PilF
MAIRMVQSLIKTMKQLEDAQKELEEEVEEIKVQTGIEKMPVEKKIEVLADLKKSLEDDKENN